MDTRHAPSDPAHRAGDALGERASAAQQRARRKKTRGADTWVCPNKYVNVCPDNYFDVCSN